jgi:hypothetical protein
MANIARWSVAHDFVSMELGEHNTKPQHDLSDVPSLFGEKQAFHTATLLSTFKTHVNLQSQTPKNRSHTHFQA